MYALVRVSGDGAMDVTDVKDAWSSVSRPFAGCGMAGQPGDTLRWWL